MTIEDFYKNAKIHDLTAQEITFLYDYAQQCDLDPSRVLVNKDFFNQVVQKYREIAPKFDSAMISSIEDKLGFTSGITQRIYSTKEIREQQKAKFYFDRFSYNPITLIKNYDDYGLWQIDLHANMDRFKNGMQGFVIFEIRHLIAYKFNTVVEDVLKYFENKFLQIPHSQNIEVLAKRKYPRIEVDIDGLVKKVGRLRDYPYYKCKICNISEGGVKICVDEDAFKQGDQLEVKFKLTYEGIEAEAIVKAHITYDGPGQYGLQFTNIDSHTHFVIAKYIQTNLKDEII
ncbi:PilZ domain-containing protein [Nitratiruptor sp. YY09-18]|uniref:PilZ domain-containing protein n=1 Tax=Nitratiruptor sp. YY09-18 TaxID=2724901 RepID=UPI0019169DCE|nr:PilZ domain-containing protein [Nitratiruptor sp. YY09-18]BCD67729.1 hypothetical protein NitYY0918_C0630 [Nitratiruptor sp. YY09-18]